MDECNVPGKEEISGIRGRVPGDQEWCDPGKEEISGIRGQVPEDQK